VLSRLQLLTDLPALRRSSSIFRLCYMTMDPPVSASRHYMVPKKRLALLAKVIRALPCGVDHKALCVQFVGEMQGLPASY
jgi:hypothetical protein